MFPRVRSSAALLVNCSGDSYLKGFTPAWYRRLGGDLETVKRSIILAAEQCHVEVTTLLVPGENDTAEELRRFAGQLLRG